ncbi:uncharacterized protein [Rutidosis leptorrhynchoides]|uniref:uncharacterized protein n=1 Tax=Rutidosis leptorrhynchoides TaxID=125765 RepID=UPI003A999EAC
MSISTALNIDYNIEYRSKNDDAWYLSGIIFENGNRLRVKFKEFPQSYYDEVFSIDDFSNHSDIDEFIGRFRDVSQPIEDNECSKVIQGMTVCAICRGFDGSIRYFDAIVDDVCYKQHTPAKCVCKYSLFWQRGPEKGYITATTLDDIWINTTGAVNPIVTEFAKLVESKLTAVSFQEHGGAGNSSHVKLSEGKERFCYELSDDDRDLGGLKDTGCHHYIILENLEKDLCPILMMQFIHEQTSITGQAYIFPNLSVETYARGVIMVDNISNIKRIYEFINNSNHIITSFSGRPWVIAEETLKTGTFNTNMQNLQPRSKHIYTGRDLMVVRVGTEEYSRAKQLKDLFMEYRNHLNGLARRLDMEEKKNQLSSIAN